MYNFVEIMTANMEHPFYQYKQVNADSARGNAHCFIQKSSHKPGMCLRTLPQLTEYLNEVETYLMSVKPNNPLKKMGIVLGYSG